MLNLFKQKENYFIGDSFNEVVTTRGLKEDQMKVIVDFIDQVIMNPEDEKIIDAVREKVNALMHSRELFNA